MELRVEFTFDIKKFEEERFREEISNLFADFEKRYKIIEFHISELGE